MKGKGNLINLITLLIAAIAAYMPNFSPSVQAWLGIVGMTLSTVLATFATNGTWVKGWSETLWVTTIAGVLVQTLNLFSEAAIIPAATITGIVTGINLFINVFYKSYDGNDTLSERKLV